MPECPKCHQPIDSQALECPYCRMTLKAHGHPGMTLYRSSGDKPLCVTCTYHEDDTCNFPKRPYAIDCTLYHDRAQPLTSPIKSDSNRFQIKVWLSRHLVWIVLLGLILLSFLIVILR